jgi:hypothetical protein
MKLLRAGAPVKRIVILIDGTWDKEGTTGNTNVAKLDVNALIKCRAANGTVQRVRYHDDAKAVLKMQINKSDRNDAVGIARIMQCGWYKEVHVKDLDSHATKALLVSRALLVKIKRDLENQIRGLLKNLGLARQPRVP